MPDHKHDDAPKAIILCVEDEERLRQDIADELTDEGYEVLQSGDGEEALAILTTKKVDLVLCDIMMPKKNGYELLKTLRDAHPQLDDLPFLFMTALAGHSDMIKGLDLGADDYLVKPVDFDLMLSRVAARLRQTERMHKKKKQEMVKLYKAFQSGKLGDKADPNSNDGRFALALKELSKSGERLGAGRMQFVSLEPFKDHYGDQWDSICDKAIRIAESVITKTLSPKDFYKRHQNKGFLFLFQGLTETESVFKTDAIASEIAHRILGDGTDVFSGLSLSVSAVKPEQLLDDQGGLNQAVLNDAFSNPVQAGVSLENRAWDGLKIDWLPVWNVRSHRVACYLAEYARRTEYGHFEGPDVVHGGLSNPYLTDLDIFLLNDLNANSATLKTVHRDRVFMVPIHYGSLQSKSRTMILDKLRSLSQVLSRHRLLIEIRSIGHDTTPAMIADEIRTLQAMAGGIGLRFEFPRLPDENWPGVHFIGMHMTVHDLHIESEALVKSLSKLVEISKASGAHSYCTGIHEQNAAWLCSLNHIDLIVGRAVASLKSDNKV